MDDADWKMMQAMVDATLLSVGVLAELLIRKQLLDREEIIATLRTLERDRQKDPADLPAQMAAAVVDRLAMNLEEGLTFLPKSPPTGGRP